MMRLESMGVLSQLFSANNCHNSVTGAEKIVNALVRPQATSLSSVDPPVRALAFAL